MCIRQISSYTLSSPFDLEFEHVKDIKTNINLQASDMIYLTLPKELHEHRNTSLSVWLQAQSRISFHNRDSGF